MKKDPIIEEVRKAGENLAREAGYDVHQFFETLRKREKLNSARIVSRSVAKYPVSQSPNMTACAENQSEYQGKQ